MRRWWCRWRRAEGRLRCACRLPARVGRSELDRCGCGRCRVGYHRRHGHAQTGRDFPGRAWPVGTGPVSSATAGLAGGRTRWPGRLPTASCAAGAPPDGGRGGPLGRPHATAGSAASWARRCGLAVEQQPLRPAGQVTGGQDQLQPDGVAAPLVKRQVAQARGLAAADAILDAGALAVAQLQHGDVAVLVGDEDLEAVPVGVGEAPGRRGGSSRRQIARVPCGQPAKSRLESSATSAPSRG